MTAELLDNANDTAYLELDGVYADRIRVSTDGNEETVNIGPSKSPHVLKVNDVSEGSVIRAADYEIDWTEWGAWSNRVTVRKNTNL